MKFTDLFIQRPVLACVISLLIFVVGLASIDRLVIRQFPEVDSSTVTIQTQYPGANQSLVQGFVTQPIQSAIGGVEGIDYMTSTSTTGQSSITVHLKLNYDVNTAINDINAEIQAIRWKLPDEVKDPVVSKDSNVSDSIMYIAYFSDRLSPEQISDYLNRVVIPQLQTVPGVAQAQAMGSREFAMRIWLDPRKMAAYHVTAQDVADALNHNNVLASPGNLKGKFDEISVQANTNISTAQDFNNIIVTQKGDQLVRIKDIGHAVLGPQSFDFKIDADNKPAVVIAINSLSTANPLTVADGIKKMLPNIAKQFPAGIKQTVLYDASIFINESIDSVIQTIIEAVIIVLIVIFLFLGTFRAVLVPVTTIPLCLVGVCTFMLWLGFSINILTLLAMVMAIGLVVDDAIVVVENINRHLELGQSPLKAALYGTREIAMPVVTMSTTLAAVFIPIGFMGGLTGKLFTEFAFVLATTVILSGVIALTLSPMMCSKLLSEKQLDARFVKVVDGVFVKVVAIYRKLLLGTMGAKPVAVLFAAVMLVGCFVLYATSKQELAPQEDQSVILAISQGPTNSNINYTANYMSELSNLYQTIPEKTTDMTISGMQGVNTGFSVVKLTPANKRNRSVFEIVKSLNQPLADVTGIQTFPILPATLPGAERGLPVQFVLKTIGSYESLNTVMQALKLRAIQSGLFTYTNDDLKIEEPQLNIDINRNLASNIGITPSDIANALSTLFSANNITRINLSGRSYEVIPQLLQRDLWNPSNINTVYMKTANGQMVPLSSIIQFHMDVVPNGLNQFQQLNSATFSGSLMPSAAMGDAIHFLINTADDIMPKGMMYDFDGQTRQFIDQPNVGFVFGFALIFIFLILSAQFESFREPIIILVSVPLCLFGALVLINLGLGSINIFTKIGLVTLIGLIAKQGILIVEFANQLQESKGLALQDAVVEAACIRLRPILMTTAAMFFGILPMLFTNAGLVRSEHQMGMVIVSGIAIGTLFTIFVVPVFYTYLGSVKKKIAHIE